MIEREIIVREWHDNKGLIHRREVGQELVRCKECKHREKYPCDHITFYECSHLRLYGTKFGVEDDFFCADGERRE